jgi:hypothetical protein
MTTRRELIEAVAARYRGAGRNQKKEILDEFVKVMWIPDDGDQDSETMSIKITK